MHSEGVDAGQVAMRLEERGAVGVAMCSERDASEVAMRYEEGAWI